jgi:hypothetical protein
MLCSKKWEFRPNTPTGWVNRAIQDVSAMRQRILELCDQLRTEVADAVTERS